MDTNELMGSNIPDTEEDVLIETREDATEPPMYKVFLHNDDYSTMEFVIEILLFVFNKTMHEATGIMLKVHREGIGLCGIYSLEIAETKVAEVHSAAREKGFPLRSTMEKD